MPDGSVKADDRLTLPPKKAMASFNLNTKRQNKYYKSSSPTFLQFL